MDLLGDILSSMDKNKRPGMSSADKLIQKQHEQLKRTAEKEKVIINNYKVKMQNTVANFLKNDKVGTMQFDPMEKIFRSVIQEAVEEAGNGLVCHTFGRDNSRYVVVYKNHPSELELEARRFYDYKQWNKEIEKEFKRKKDEEAAIAEPSTSSISTNNSSDTNESSKTAGKKQKLIHLECQAINTDPNRNFGMVSSELKKDKRTVEQTLNDIQQKKRLKTQVTNENNN